jgi:hypothetical protein
VSEKDRLADELLEHIDPDMDETERRQHARAIAADVLRRRGAFARLRAISRALGIDDMLRDIEPRRK